MTRIRAQKRGHQEQKRPGALRRGKKPVCHFLQRREIIIRTTLIINQFNRFVKRYLVSPSGLTPVFIVAGCLMVHLIQTFCSVLANFHDRIRPIRCHKTSAYARYRARMALEKNFWHRDSRLAASLSKPVPSFAAKRSFSNAETLENFPKHVFCQRAPLQRFKCLPCPTQLERDDFR